VIFRDRIGGYDVAEYDVLGDRKSKEEDGAKGEEGRRKEEEGGGEGIKNGKKADGRQTYLCKECGRRMVERPKYKRMREEDLELAVRMRDEGMSYSAIARVLGYGATTIRTHLQKKP